MLKTFLAFLGRVGLGPEKNRLNSGAIVKRNGRDSYLYCMNGKNVDVNVEMQVGIPDRIIYAQSITQWVSEEGQTFITPEEKKKVIDDLLEYFNQQGHTCKVD